MSEENKIVEQKLKEATGQDVTIQQAYALNEKLYINLYNNLYRELSESNISKKNVLRAVFKALDIGVDSGEAPKLVEETEAKSAGYFGQLLDKRNVILARKMQEEEVAERLAFEEAQAAQLELEKLNKQGEK